MNQVEKEIRANIKEFRIISVAPGIAEVDIFFPLGFVGFKGHFPDNPILPGICIIKALLVKLMVWREAAVQLVEMENVKFYSPVQPDVLLKFESKIAVEPDSDFCIVSSKVTCDSRKIANLKLKVILKPV